MRNLPWILAAPSAVLLLVTCVLTTGCQERVVRQTEYGAATPFGSNYSPEQKRPQQQKSQGLSTDWRGTPRINGQPTGAQPAVPSGSAATPRTKR